jgi:hypothetical protein
MITGKRRKDNDNYSWIRVVSIYNFAILQMPWDVTFFAFISGLLKTATPINDLLQVQYVSRCQ